MHYKNRAQEIKAMKREAVAAMGLHLSPAQNTLLWKLLRITAIVGAIEERSHSLACVDRSRPTSSGIRNDICAKGIVKMLGFKED